MIKLLQTFLDTRPIPPEYLTSSAELRYTLIDTLQILLQQTNHTLITPPEITPDPETFLNSLKTNPNIYQASMSRQFAADLPPDIEKTTLKDEPKDWYIKTADFGDTHDRPLQHRDGEYTQLLEDLDHYHQILQQNCDRIIVLRSANYGGYDTLINAAMQCLGYSLTQFRYIIIQPIKLYAFHQPSQKLHAIPDLPPNELLKAIGPDALHWHSLNTPLTEPAPINISTAGRPTPQDSLHCIQSSYTRCHTLLSQAQEQNPAPLTIPTPYTWQPYPQPTLSPPTAITLFDLLENTQTCLHKAAQDIAPHYICHHLEQISNTCHQYLNETEVTTQNHQLLLDTQYIIHSLLTLLGISVPQSISQLS